MFQIEILRLNEVIKLMKRSKTMLHSDQQRGLFPKQIKHGGSRASGYLLHEVQAVIAARAAGYNNNQIKALVIQLHAQRKILLKDILLTLQIQEVEG